MAIVNTVEPLIIIIQIGTLPFCPLYRGYDVIKLIIIIIAIIINVEPTEVIDHSTSSQTFLYHSRTEIPLYNGTSLL